MTHETALRIIGEFMGWDTDIVQDSVVVFFIGKNCYDTESFDTMRMVFDKWMIESKPYTRSYNWTQWAELRNDIKEELTEGTTTDCAIRLAEAIEWWKSVK